MNCGFKAYDTEMARSLNLYGDMHRDTPVLGKMNGAKVSEIAINHRKRIHGKSKYGARRIVRGMLDLMTVGFLFSFLEECAKSTDVRKNIQDSFKLSYL